MITSIRFLLFGSFLAFGSCAFADAEADFIAMLKNATLKGTWAPVAGGQIGEDKDDAYHIVGAVKKDGDNWHIVTKVKHQEQEFEYPIPVIVKFAGDTAVMILNDSPTGDGGKWSARVMFHNDVYAGSWWNTAGKAGTIAGTVSRAE
ncbi:MAG: hypothetical protein AAF585_22840 [Verrucomicrobiota bacterium]